MKSLQDKKLEKLIEYIETIMTKDKTLDGIALFVADISRATEVFLGEFVFWLFVRWSVWGLVG